MKRVCFLLFCVFPLVAGAQFRLQGTVIDSISQEPLPFVNIAIKGTTHGCVSTMSGKFTLDTDHLPVTLLFSYVGYKKKEITFANSGNQVLITLVSSVHNLNEVTVFSGPDYGLLLMAKVVKNSAVNNPEKNCTYSYKSYNKLVFTLDADEPSLDKKIDSLKNDSTAQAGFKFFKQQHLFISESVSEKKFKSPSLSKETVLASKVSGFNTPVFTLLSTQLQSFHFYKNEISLSDVKYIGPVSKLGLKHYRFILSDTFYLDKDTVFSLQFVPKKENDPRSLKGVLQISTDGYALYNVIAEPEKIPETGFTISIFQQYQKVENKQWFPVELNTTLTFPSIKIEQFAVKGVGTGSISDIKLNPEFSRKDFDEIDVALHDSIMQYSNEKLKLLRKEDLTDKEKNTYRYIDSIGKKYQLDKKMLVMQSLIYGYVPVKVFDWDIGKLLSFDGYQGFRINGAFRTNYKISKWVSLGGYIGYGFKDRAWKYGTDLNIIFSRRKQIELNISAQQDVEAGSIITTFERKNLVSPYGYSEFFLSRYDSVQRYQAKFSFRSLKHFKVTFFGNYQVRDAYQDYLFTIPINENLTLLDPSYDLTETGAELRIAVNEKFLETPFGFLSEGTKWPIIYLRYTKGISGIAGSSFDYNRFTLKMNYTYTHLRIGTIYFGLAGGLVTGEAPYHLLFSPAGTYQPIKKLTVYSMDGFETMRVNELLYDQMITFHFRYSFAKPIINGKKFKPTLSLANSIAYGKLESDLRHANLFFFGTTQPFLESGLIIDNLLKSGVSGLGVGGFYRWGPLALRSRKDNLAIKISVSLSLN